MKSCLNFSCSLGRTSSTRVTTIHGTYIMMTMLIMMIIKMIMMIMMMTIMIRWAHAFGYIMAGSSMICIPVYAIWLWTNTEGTRQEVLFIITSVISIITIIISTIIFLSVQSKGPRQVIFSYHHVFSFSAKLDKKCAKLCAWG